MAKGIDAAKTTRYSPKTWQKEHAHDERHQSEDSTDSQPGVPVWTVSLQRRDIREAQSPLCLSRKVSPKKIKEESVANVAEINDLSSVTCPQLRSSGNSIIGQRWTPTNPLQLDVTSTRPSSQTPLSQKEPRSNPSESFFMSFCNSRLHRLQSSRAV